MTDRIDPIRRLRPALASLLFLALGCAGKAAVDPRPIAEDPVCLYNRDLGCVRVRVDEKTPHAVYHGETYYFCNDSCREAFVKNPTKYLPHAGG
jgi:YHS domain-containing protein